MKLYVIPKGTPVTLVDKNDFRKQMVSNAEASFTETITDPVREWNTSKRTISYYLFQLEPNMKSKANRDFVKVEVDQRYVEVLC